MVPERIRHAVDLLDVRPSDRLLEVGCGPGVAAAEVCARLDTGHLVAVDRSPVAVERTLRRNAAHVDAGRLEVRCAALDALDLPPATLDAAFAVDVNLFWTRSPTAELDVLWRALKPGGRLLVVYGASGPQPAGPLLAKVASALEEHGFVAAAPSAAAGAIAVSATRP